VRDLQVKYNHWETAQILEGRPARLRRKGNGSVVENLVEMYWKRDEDESCWWKGCGDAGRPPREAELFPLCEADALVRQEAGPSS
jgi:hypothetical protein